VWFYDVVEEVIHNGRKYRMLNIIDEFGGEPCHVPRRRFPAEDVLAVRSLRRAPSTGTHSLGQWA